MICMLDNYSFELLNVEEVKKKITFGWSKHQRLSNHPKKQAVGKYEESFEIEAVFYKKKRSFLVDFEDMAKEKKPLWLVFPTGEALEVIISEVELTKSYFDDAGSPLKQVINFKMEVFYE